MPPSLKKRKHQKCQVETEPGRCHFSTLPFELIAEILIYTNSPRDVLAVARCSKFLCHTLLYPTSAFIWKAVRKTCSIPPPEPMSIFTESSYAAYLYGGGPCESCKNHTDQFYLSFGIRLRLCPNHECKRKFVNKGDHASYVPDARISRCIPYIEDKKHIFPSTRRLPRCYRPSDAALAFISHSANPAEYLSNIQAKMDFIEKYMEFCVSLNKWKISWQEAYEVMSSVNEGIAVSIAHMYGWNIRDMMSSTPYGPMHRLKNSRIELVTPEGSDFLLTPFSTF
ncbi:hypothetical protein H0H93_012097 [Arthromyces matolae]|nr:hypothetical protein H0H93_012097 [Arthromyces matolae]